MTLIRSHSCTKCGGALIVHNDRQQYECPYCSVFYDYEYFRSRIILEQAAASQKMLQYDSAKEKYEFILQKDPHNFLALRGNLLCEAGINLPTELRKPEKVICIIPSSLAHAEEMTEPEGKEYFHKLILLREIARFIRTNRQQKENLEKAPVKMYTASGSIPLTPAERAEELAKNRERIQRFSKGFAQFYSQLEDLEPEEIKQEKLRKDSGKDVKTDDEKKLGLKASLSCTSCGGELVVNLNRQVYECPFCGLSFDYDFIRDEIAHSEAEKALKESQFIKADAIYEYILASDPKNFEALRGRILCAATWENLQNPLQDIEFHMKKAHVPTMIVRIEEALAACEESDRQYFEMFKMIVPENETVIKFFGTMNDVRSNNRRLNDKWIEMEKEYEKLKQGIKPINYKILNDYALTARELEAYSKMSVRMKEIELEREEIYPKLREISIDVANHNQDLAFVEGNIRQLIAGLIRFEWERENQLTK